MSDTKISKVLHLSNVPHAISSDDIIKAVETICLVEKVIVLRPKNQVLIEFYTIQDAQNIYNRIHQKKLLIKGSSVSVSYSHHMNLTKQLNQNDVHNICSQFGTVEKIRMFTHASGPQALVQYSKCTNCKQVKEKLDKYKYRVNKHQYAFEVQFSNKTDLIIEKKSNYSRDFLLNPLKDLPEFISNPKLSSSSNCSPRSNQSSFSNYSYQSNPNYNNLNANMHNTIHHNSHNNSHNNHNLQNNCGSSNTSQQVNSIFNNSNSYQLHSLLYDYELAYSNYKNNSNPCSCNIKTNVLPSSESYNSVYNYTTSTLLPTHSMYSKYSLNNPSMNSSYNSSYSQQSVQSIQSIQSVQSIQSIHNVFNTNSITYSDTTQDYNHKYMNSNSNSMPSYEMNYQLRWYVFEGFSHILSFIELTSFLYKICIKDYKYINISNNNYRLVLYGISEWSDTMLVSYLNQHPIDGQIIRLKSTSYEKL